MVALGNGDSNGRIAVAFQNVDRANTFWDKGNAVALTCHRNKDRIRDDHGVPAVVVALGNAVLNAVTPDVIAVCKFSHCFCYKVEENVNSVTVWIADCD